MWLRSDSVLKAVIILDNSVSMAAFKDELEDRLNQRLSELKNTASKTEWILITSDINQGTLYSGYDLNKLHQSLKKWTPSQGHHDLLPAINLAQNMIRQKGHIIFVSDHKQSLPVNIEHLSVGYPIDNCGFTGLKVDRNEEAVKWNVLVKNYGQTPQKRNWWIETKNQKQKKNTIQLNPGESMTLSGFFPTGIDQFVLYVEPDRFTLDDRCPVMRPKSKQLGIKFNSDSPLASFYQKVLTVFQDINPNHALIDSDLTFTEFQSNETPEFIQNGVSFLIEHSTNTLPMTGTIIAENHPLMEDLNWQSLIINAEPLNMNTTKNDQILLWQGKRPLILLRSDDSIQRLIINFDLHHSNALKTPALVILLHRFIESSRDKKVAAESGNYELSQLARIACDPDGREIIYNSNTVDSEAAKETAFRPSKQTLLRAPAYPGFFTVKQGNKTLLNGASSFADVREANFKKAVSIYPSAEKVKTLTIQNSRHETLWPIWALLILGLLLGNYSLKQEQKIFSG